MDEQVYRRALAAIAAQQNALTAPDQRQAAYHELELFKQRDDCPEYAMYILGNALPEHDQFSRHFAIQALDHAASTYGNEATPRGEQIREKAVILLTNRIRGVTEEEYHLKEATAKFITGLAEVSFPSVWPDFLSLLFGAWQNSGEATAELCMMVLRNLAEDCTDSNFNSKLTSKNRNQILKAVNSNLEPFLCFTFQYLQVQYEAYGAAPGAPVPTLLLKSGVEMLQRLFAWINIDSLITDAHDFLTVCLVLLPHLDLRESAANALVALVSRKIPQALMQRIITQFPDALALSPRPSSAEEHLSFWRSIAIIMSDVTFVNSIQLTEDKVFLESQGFNGFLSFAIGLLDHPSLRLASDMHRLWLTISRTQPFNGSGSFPMVIPQLISSYVVKMVRPAAGSLDDGELADIYNEEFSDDDDLIAFIGQFRGQISQLLRLFGKSLPVQSLTALHGLISQHINSALVTPPFEHADAQGRVTLKSPTWQILESLCQAVEGVTASLTEEMLLQQGDVGTVLRQGCNEVVYLLLSWAPTDPLLLWLKLAYLSHFTTFYSVQPERLWDLMEACFQCLEYGDPDHLETTQSKSHEPVQQLRRKAGACLIHLAKHVPEKLEPHIDGIAGRVFGLVQGTTLTDMQKMHCFEMLVAISNAVKDPARRAAIVEQIVTPALNDWQGSAEVKTLLESPANLLGQGMGLGGDGSTSVQTFHQQIGALANSLSTIQGICRRVVGSSPVFKEGADPAVENPFWNVWPQVLPNLMRLVEVLHQIWAPPFRDELLIGGPATSHVLGMPEQELHVKSNLSGITQPRTDNSVAPLHELRPRWLNELRNLSYSILGIAAMQGALYVVPGALEAFKAQVFSNLEHLEHRHYNLLLKHVLEPFVLYCPPGMYTTALSPIVGPTLAHSVQRLSFVWSENMPMPSPGPRMGVAPVDPAHFSSPPPAAFSPQGGFVALDTSENIFEIIFNKTRAEMTRTFVTMLQTWLALSGELQKAFIKYEQSKPWTGKALNELVDKSEKKVVDNAKGKSWKEEVDAPRKRDVAELLAQYLFHGDQQVAQPLAASIVSALLWPDGQVCTRAIRLSLRLLEVAHTNSFYEPLLGTHLFHAATHLLVSEPPWTAGIEWEILNLIREVYCLMTFGIVADKLIYVAASKLDGKHDASSLPAAIQVAGLPRHVLMSLEGISQAGVVELDQALYTCTDTKSQKEAFRELLRNNIKARVMAPTDPLQQVRRADRLMHSRSDPAIMQLSQVVQHQRTSGSGVPEETLEGLAFLFHQ